MVVASLDWYSSDPIDILETEQGKFWLERLGWHYRKVGMRYALGGSILALLTRNLWATRGILEFCDAQSFRMRRDWFAQHGAFITPDNVKVCEFERVRQAQWFRQTVLIRQHRCEPDIPNRFVFAAMGLLALIEP